MAGIGAGAAAILPSAPVAIRSNDVEFIFRQDSDFHYLTDFAEPESVALFANITPEFASSLGPRTIPERARSAVFLGVEAVLISGPMTGTPTDIAELRAAKAAVPAAPVLANTGVTADTVAQILAVADGAIVGTALKRDAVTWNPVDPGRAATFMEAARRARESAVVG